MMQMWANFVKYGTPSASIPAMNATCRGNLDQQSTTINDCHRAFASAFRINRIPSNISPTTPSPRIAEKETVHFTILPTPTQRPDGEEEPLRPVCHNNSSADRFDARLRALVENFTHYLEKIDLAMEESLRNVTTLIAATIHVGRPSATELSTATMTPETASTNPSTISTRGHTLEWESTSRSVLDGLKSSCVSADTWIKLESCLEILAGRMAVVKESLHRGWTTSDAAVPVRHQPPKPAPDYTQSSAEPFLSTPATISPYFREEKIFTESVLLVDAATSEVPAASAVETNEWECAQYVTAVWTLGVLCVILLLVLMIVCCVHVRLRRAVEYSDFWSSFFRCCWRSRRWNLVFLLFFALFFRYFSIFNVAFRGYFVFRCEIWALTSTWFRKNFAEGRAPNLWPPKEKFFCDFFLPLQSLSFFFSFLFSMGSIKVITLL